MRSDSLKSLRARAAVPNAIRGSDRDEAVLRNAALNAQRAALRAADDFIGNISRIERASTDANIPLSLGIDALAIGSGGTGGGAHSLQEWYEPSGREKGLQRALLTILGASGIAVEKGK